MEVLVRADGQRDRSFRPYINQEELKRNLILYDPNGYNVGTGLYDRTQQTCGRWVDHFHQFQKKHHTPPEYIVEPNGRSVYITDKTRPSGNFVSYR
jgi:hypothetical protein